MDLLHQYLIDGKAILTSSEQERQALFSACEEFGLSSGECKRAIAQKPYDEKDLCFVLDWGHLKWGRLSSLEAISKYKDNIIAWRSMSGQPVFTY